MFAGLSRVITNAVNIDTRQARAERNPATTGRLISHAHRKLSTLPEPTESTSRAMHYYAKTMYHANYFYWLLFALSILASLFYFVVRIIYIAQGRSAPKIPLNLTVESNGRNVTVQELLPPGMDIGDELTDDLLKRPEFAGLKRVIDDETYSYWWSCVVLAAEIGGFILVHVSQQMFIRQDTKFYPLPPEHVQHLRDVRFNVIQRS
jgi:hypothetical protein